ncbi:methionyl-tRNA formyltransferase [Staphylococcus saprophyticus]|jgi:methionyl-tRNA formyltransferase|uniref:methionyl-tRNA formyltransferase n=1 Tax=Staphylococcus saprophyticus TaxID=29385 RepID=UPI000D1E2195|nr:methionyl-tRNA formyltransferase [Staphylococcus saprophyticus]MBC2921094.1 methionyl-tRNA formyltransferase [Staphylococcus saprophyticus]MBC2956799.1 methionyl-tRNA formyltransferase [Staphylococcus saprophyticus]MBC3009079.1 methionyl-tRNA formyltransferase [Staphylococcus saprophyticus]MBC3022958.1 methionyl-tRNA formyltransferase [Staphylococcus saprophyticus]MBC3029783.1 methionyl-tRNA formyltransferase [Staphylococcus saprophyticus]
MSKVIFMGTPDFSTKVLEMLIAEHDVIAVVTQPDRPVGRKRVLTPPPVKEVAIKHGLPVYQPEKLAQSSELEQLIDLEADLIVTAAFGQILPESLLNAPKLGAINVHASLLPKYRGGAPIHQAIMDGQTETGISIMYMVKKLDAGDIISQQAIEIEHQDDVGTMHDKLSFLGAELLKETLPSIINGTNNRITQNESEASFATNISREQEKIDWYQSAEVIYNHIRGLSPWPVAYTVIDDGNMKVYASRIEKGKTGEPGTIIETTKKAIIVATGSDDAIALTDIQVAGKKRMLTANYLSGVQTSLVGKVLT